MFTLNVAFDSHAGGISLARIVNSRACRPLRLKSIRGKTNASLQPLLSQTLIFLCNETVFIATCLEVDHLRARELRMPTLERVRICMWQWRYGQLTVVGVAVIRHFARGFRLFSFCFAPNTAEAAQNTVIISFR